MKISKNKLLATLLVITTISAAFAIQSIISVNATQYINANSYCWIEGVFHNDTYALYPYAQESLDIGFSKYGEMIGYNEATGIGLGLQYPGYHSAGDTYDQNEETSVDPFANEIIDIDVWMNGWFIDMKYRKASGEWREIWAMALFSDGAQHGGIWIKMPEVTEFSSTRPLWQEFPPYANPDSDSYSAPKPSYGGRKSNGDCVTQPINIVYNGPRKLVAVLETKISDGATSLVNVVFTIIFNKSDKNVIVLKDVKRLYDKGPINVQFGNRGEWDLSPPSYVHFYTDEPVTSWDVDDSGTIDPIDEGHDFFFEYMTGTDVATGAKHPKKWWDEVPLSEYPTEVEGVPFDPNAYPFNEWFETQYTCYGQDWHTDKNIKEHSYAVAQVIDADAEYVGALAIWPHPEFWSVQNSYPNPYAPPATIPLMLAPISRMLEWHRWTVDEDPISGDYPHGQLADRNNTWIKMDDMTFEPDIPFIIYEHDFKLQLGVTDIYRIVSVYVLTDWHDADDYNANDLNGNGVVENLIDREVQYQLDEIFDPWDINDAMHKNTKRWVEFFNRDIDAKAWDGLHYYQIQLPSERQVENGEWIPTVPVYRGGAWDAYCTVSERVLVNTGTGYELIWPHEDGLNHDPPPRLGSDDYHMLDPIPYETTGENTPYYTIELSTGIISFYKWDEDLEEYVKWYLPTGSLVKVEWSSEHQATAADQWDETDEVYPIDGYNYEFPLLHDIIDDYRDLTEVFLIEQPAERIFNVSKNDGTPWYALTLRSTTLRVYNVSKCYEIDIKYNATNLQGSWVEEKFHSNGSITQQFTLSYTAGYVEKVWIHSEKTLTTGDYVFNEDEGLLYMEEPLEAGQWLFVNYTHLGTLHEDWFYGYDVDGDGILEAWERNVFGPLTVEPDVGSLQVWNTKKIEEIINETCYGAYPYGTWVQATGMWTPGSYTKHKPSGDIGMPSDALCPVPDEAYAGLPLYKPKAWVKHGWYSTTQQYEECEWIVLTDLKLRGNYIIRETSTCDELVMDQAPLNSTQVRELPGTVSEQWPGQELKIVFKVPSGRWEWATVGKTAASVDSLGVAMVTAAFKNKLIEIGIGGLDIQDTAQGPRVPWLVAGTADSLGRYSLYDDWCYSRTGDTNALDTSWPISSSNIITVGGGAVNKLALYSNDWTQAIVTSTPKLYSVTCWDRDEYTGGDVTARYGYAIISTYKDKNATAILLIQGWTGQDTYYACKWFDYNKYWLQHINTHVTDLVLKIEYKYSSGAIRCVPVVTIVEKLGTISEKPQHDP
jgi:hypothetical protein